MGTLESDGAAIIGVIGVVVPQSVLTFTLIDGVARQITYEKEQNR